MAEVLTPRELLLVLDCINEAYNVVRSVEELHEIWDARQKIMAWCGHDPSVVWPYIPRDAADPQGEA